MEEEAFSVAKPKIPVGKCPKAGSKLFPLDKDPREWPSCNDAYSYYWNSVYASELGMN